MRSIKPDYLPSVEKDIVYVLENSLRNILTNKGKFTAQEELKNFDNNTSIWFPLFEEVNKVIAELRIAQEEMQRNKVTRTLIISHKHLRLA